MALPQSGPSLSSPDVSLSSFPKDGPQMQLQVAAIQNTFSLQSLDSSPDMQQVPIRTPI